MFPTSGLDCWPVLVEVAAWASVAKANSVCRPGWSAAVVALKLPPPVGVAADHGPCQVSTWKRTPCTAGAVGLKVEDALRLNVGVADVVVLPARGVMVVVSGMAWVGASVITVTLALPMLAT